MAIDPKDWEKFLRTDEENENHIYAVQSSEEVSDIEQHPMPSRITSAMAWNLSRGKKELDIFKTLDAAEYAGLKAFDDAHTIDRNGKPFYISNFQTRLLAHLSRYITRQEKSKDIEYLLENMDKGNTLNNLLIRRPINIAEFASQVFRGRKSRKERAQLLRELYELATIKQVQSYEIKTEQGKTVKKQAAESIIELRGGTCIMRGEKPITLLEATDAELETIDFIDVVFTPLFFVGLKSRWAALTDQLLDLWGVKGNGTETELFAVLLMRLLSNYWQVYSTYKNTQRATRAKAKEENLDKEERRAALDNAARKAQKQYLEAGTIEDALSKPYGRRKSLMKDHLTRAFKVFVEIGLVDEYTIDPKTLAMNFYYSTSYGMNIEEAAGGPTETQITPKIEGKSGT